MVFYSDLILKSFSSSNVPNLMIYGNQMINKLEILKEIISKKYKITKEKKIKEKNIEIIQTEIYYLFNLSSITSKNYSQFIEVLTKYISLKDYFSKNINKYIIFNNFTNIKSSIQNSLRVLIEKYRITSVFIILTDKLGNIIEPLKSRCLMVRIPLLKNKEKRKIFYKNIQTIKPDKNYDKTFDFIYNLNDDKIIKDCVENQLILENYKNPYKKISENIISLYEKRINKDKFKELKNISYIIIRYDLFINLFYSNFLELFLNNQRIRDKNKIDLIKYFANSEYNYNNSYRSIIIIESLLIYCYNIYNLSPSN